MTSKIKIVFLGTSASIPSANRNPSAIFLNYNNENMLIDCSEGTQRQLRKAKLNPCDVNRILITHWHGDHVLGLPALFQTLVLSGYNKKMQIYGPKDTKIFMSNFIKIFSPVFTFKADIYEIPKSGKFFENDEFYLESEKMDHGIPTNAYNFVIKDKLRIDKTKLKKCKIPEGPLLKNLKEGKDIVCNGKKYKAKDLTYLEKGKKISFVLDTKFNDKIEKFVKEADFFICESSFGSDLKDLAKEHLHMTAEQAGIIAKKAKVKKLILTHISQRYDPNLKFLLNDAKKNFKNVVIAEDLNEFEIN
jgi:ribonuclease Z